MKIFKFDRFELVCEYWETSRAWGHRAVLLDRGVELADVKVRYYNRTWERYTYQSAMREAVEKWHGEELARYLERKREEFGGTFPRGAKKVAVENFELDGYKELVKAIEEY